MSSNALLDVRDLRTYFFQKNSVVRAVDGVSFDIRRGEMFGLAGESGSGKSVTALSIMRLLDKTARVVDGQILFEGQDLLTLPESQMRNLRGDRLAMIFQDPMTSLNPVLTVGHQIAETVVTHRGKSWDSAMREAKELLELVGIEQADSRVNAYPHQFSGGMRQRVMIAMAVALRPALLVADEPTTALDVTVQKQILALLRRLCTDLGMAVLLVTHNLAVVAENCHRIGVMYAGQMIELADTDDLFKDPLHPYTQGLLSSMPLRHISEGRLKPIAGQPPVMVKPLPGCHFALRCSRAIERCSVEPQVLREVRPGHWARCGLVEQTRTETPVALQVPA